MDSYFSNQNANNQAFSFESTGVFFNAKKVRDFLYPVLYLIKLACGWQSRKVIITFLCSRKAGNELFVTSFYSYSFFFLFSPTGLCISEELLEVDYLVCHFLYSMLRMWFCQALKWFRSEPSSKVYLMQPRSCSRAMKAVGVVEASCEEIFELVMSMDGTRYEYVSFLFFIFNYFILIEIISVVSVGWVLYFLLYGMKFILSSVLILHVSLLIYLGFVWDWGAITFKL